MVPDIKRILYASDMEADSIIAFRIAVSMATQHQAKITYLHVVESLTPTTRNLIENSFPEGSLDMLENEGYEEIKAKALQRILLFLESEVPLEYQSLSSSIEPLIKKGESVEAILNTADQLDADLIVMGARSHSVVERVFLGSTAHKVLQNSSRPVLIVPIPAQAQLTK